MTGAETRKRKSRFRWLRRGFLLVVVLVFLGIALQVLLNAALPYVLSKVLASEELDLSLGHINVSLLKGEVEFRDASLSTLGKDDTWIDVDYGHVAVSVRDLFSGALRIERCVVDGVRFELEIGPDGEIVLPGNLAGDGAVEEETEDEAPAGGGMFPILPFPVDQIRILHAKVHFADRTNSPPVEAQVDVNVSVSDFCSTTKPNRFDLHLQAPGLFRSLHVKGEGTSAGYVLDAGTSLRIEGLDPEPLKHYLSSAGIRTDTGFHVMDMNIQVKSGALETQAGVWTGWLEVRDFQAVPVKGESLTFDCIHGELDVNHPDVPDRMRIRVEEGHVPVKRQASGALCASILVFQGGEESTVEEEEDPGEPNLLLEKIQVHGLDVAIRDEAVSPPADFVLILSQGIAESLSPDRAHLNVLLNAPGVFSTLALDAEAGFSDEEKTLAAELKLEGIDMNPVRSYLQDLELDAYLQEGALAMKLDARMVQGQGDLSTGEIALKDLKLENGGELLGLDLLEVKGIEIHDTSRLARVDAVTLEGFRSLVGQEAGGALRVLGFRVGPDTLEPEVGKFDVRAGLTLNHLDFPEGSDPDVPEAGEVNVWLEAPGLVDRVEAKGTLAPGPSETAVHLNIDSRGFQSSFLAPIVESQGIAFHKKALDLHFDLSADLGKRKASLHLEDLILKGDDESLISLESIEAGKLELDEGSFQMGLVEVKKPRARIHLDSEGTLILAGMTFSSSEGEAEPSNEDPSSLRVALDELRLVAAGIDWLDESVDPPVQASAEWDLTVKNGVMDEECMSLPFHLQLRLEDTLEKLDLSGTVARANKGFETEFTLRGSGIKDGAAADYLPLDADLVLHDGRLDASIKAKWFPNKDGGKGAALEIHSLEYRDGDQGAPLLKADVIRCRASRIDPEGKIIDLEEIAVSGLSTGVDKGADGSVKLLGFRFGPARPQEDSRESMEDVDSLFPEELLIAPVLREILPMFTLDTLDLDIERLYVRDEAKGSSMGLEDLAIRNSEPIELLGKDPSSRPPVRLDITGTVNPLDLELKAKLQATPFNIVPGVSLALDAKALNGEGLAILFPGIKDRLDLEQFTEGRFHGELNVMLKADRRSALDFDFSRGLGMEVDLKGLEITRTGEEGIVAGLDLLHMDVARIDPKEGDIHVRTLEIMNPKGRIFKDAQGLKFLGIPLTSSAPPSGEQVLEESAPKVEQLPPAPRPEFRVDRLFINDIDLVYEDRTLTPPLVLPLTAIDAEMRNFTTRATDEPEYLVFYSDINAGEVELPVRGKKGNILSSLGNSVVDLAGMGSEQKVEMVKQPLFEVVNVHGRIAFYPAFTGWITAGMDALELRSFSGLASKGDVTLEDGIMDGRLDLRFAGDGSMDVKTNLVFTHLSLTEPSGGTVESILKLPVSLDTGIFLLRNEAGEVVVPLSFHVPPDGMTRGEITWLAAGAFQKLITNAVPGYALRLTSVVTDFLPTGGGDEEPEKKVVIDVPFGPGDAYMDRAAHKELSQVVELMKQDDSLKAVLNHQLGGGDITRAESRANPPEEDIREYSNRLRLRKKALIRERSAVAWDVRALRTANLEAEASKAARRLRWLDRELGLADRTLDEILDMLRPGAHRRSASRTRRGCISMGLARLDAVREALEASGVEGIENRITMMRPRVTSVAAEGDEGGMIKVTLNPSRVR